MKVGVFRPCRLGLWRGCHIKRRLENGLEYDSLVPGAAWRAHRGGECLPPSSADRCVLQGKDK